MTNCPDCFGKKWLAKIDKRTGLQIKDGQGRKLFFCFRCGRVVAEEINSFLPTHLRLKANVLYFDLEVSLSQYYNYGARVPNKFLSPDNLIRPYFIICWSAGYMHSRTIWSDCVTAEEALAGDDSRILPRLQELMASADILAGHNVDAYDVKRANTRLLLTGGEPVIGKKTFDTLKIARSKFAFESNRLGDICAALGLRGKDGVTGDDWRAIMRGDEKPLRKVARYNARDVRAGKAVLGVLQKYSGKKVDYGTVKLETVTC